MVVHAVTWLRDQYLARKPLLSLPALHETIPVEERIKSICRSVQSDAIFQKHPPPQIPKGTSPEEKARIFDEYFQKHSELLKQGIGRQPFVGHYPDYRDPDSIPANIQRVYDIKPDGCCKAGLYAEKIIGITPRNSVFAHFNFSEEESYMEVSIPGTDLIIKGQTDLEDIDQGLYEFKLTKRVYLQKKVSEALIQLFLYDLLYRIKYNIRCFMGLRIEVYLIDQKKILSYRPFDEDEFAENPMRDYQDYVENTLKKTLNDLFQKVLPDYSERMSDLLNEIYGNIRMANQDDREAVIRRHQTHNINPE